MARNERSDPIAMVEVLLMAQLLAQESGFQQWVDSRDPEELCQI